MPSLSSYKKIMRNNGSTVGQSLKLQSDKVMEATWDHDLESKECYIYDFFHDDQPNLSQGMTYENTTKTKIDIKFIMTQNSSVSKDEIDFQIQFKPSQKVVFDPSDDLYYFETNYRHKYYSEFPLGMYIDIYDDQDKMYHKWLVIAKEDGLQFIKYHILKCNYYYHWIEHSEGKRWKRKMWGVRRTQLSYSSGIWGDNYTTTPQNQSLIWLPMNIYSSYLYYNHPDTGANQRIVMSSPGTDRPIVWQISKVETAQPLGVNKLTLYQTEWNPDSDYIDQDEVNEGDLFAMYADYFPSKDMLHSHDPILLNSNYHVDIYSSNATIKVGGSYKTLTLKVVEDEHNDVTEKYLDKITLESWHCYVNDEDLTDFVTWLEQDDKSKIKIKFLSDRNYIGKILKVTCELEPNLVGEILLTISAV